MNILQHVILSWKLGFVDNCQKTKLVEKKKKKPTRKKKKNMYASYLDVLRSKLLCLESKNFLHMKKDVFPETLPSSYAMKKKKRNEKNVKFTKKNLIRRNQLFFFRFWTTFRVSIIICGVRNTC